MPLSINTNLTARNTVHNFNRHALRLSTSLQRLSSGLRVNSAADDAAGLAVRELMRADVTALHQGMRNVNDAVSMIQVADGALAVIDEKLIRMKELAEQAATGTYNSTQRLIIDREFQAMGAEIDRIARSTDFNGIKLLDGSLAGNHDGSGLNAAGKMKIHFGTGNESAEDYYYVEIGDCTLAGLGLSVKPPVMPWKVHDTGASLPGGQIVFADGTSVSVNNEGDAFFGTNFPHPHGSPPSPIQETFWVNDWNWSCGVWSGFGFLHRVPAGTKNVMFNLAGGTTLADPVTGIRGVMVDGILYDNIGDNDIQLFTMDGKHLAGTPLTDPSFQHKNYFARPEYQTGRLSPDCDIYSYSPWLGFTEDDYDDSFLNSGPADYETGYVDNSSLNWTTYNGMRIGYSGDGNLNNDGNTQAGSGCEVLVIDGEVTEDLLIWIPDTQLVYKMYWDGGPGRPREADEFLSWNILNVEPTGMPVSVATQEQAQRILGRLDEAVAQKDTVRAHLGALQNRLENTVTNLSVRAEHLQAAESRISDVDVAAEMTAFVRNQIFTQSAVALLGQANSLSRMLIGLMEG